VPCGIVDEASGALHITFGSSYKTSDFIVDTIEAKWEAMAEQEQAETSLIQIKMDNGPESSGRRTQFRSRMVQLADRINKPLQLLYYPPYPTFKGVWYAAVNFALVPLLDTRLDQCPRPHR